MRNTLSKSAILRGHHVFRNIFNSGVCFTSTQISCYVLFGEESKQSPIQWGFSISKKRVPLAVDRNRIRRLMKETVRLHSAELREELLKKNRSAKIVMLYKNSGGKELRRLKLHNIVENWNETKKKIIEAIL